MSLASLKDLYLDELGDLYDAENQMIRALSGLADAAHAPELKEALTRHCDESRLHLERLQLIFTHWGEKTRSRRCAGLAGIVQEADDRLTQATTPDARDAGIIGVAQRIEHYEIAAYGCARTYARRLNRPDEARLLQETLDEEGRADRRLTEIAEAHVNDDARLETDLQPEPSARILRYVDARRLQDSRLSRGTLEVRNDADDKLGTLAGLIVDAAAGLPRYIVVAAGRPFSSREVLLPLSEVRFDPTAGVLRIQLDKDIAARYPEFDRDEFEAMSGEAVRAYEGRLIDFFPKQAIGAPVPPVAEGEPPEWLVKSVWLTVPPGRTDPLSDEAHAMLNEFAPPPGGDDPGVERFVARADADTPRPIDPGQAPTPPQGEKLR